jgi:phosphoribosylformylglycinamidine (FGAM) synthase-like amidotransferase family enzyme
VGTLTFNGVHSDVSTRTTIRMRYANGDSTQRFATIEVNGAAQTVAFVPTTNGQVTGIASFSADLTAGSSNTVKVSGVNGGWGKLILSAAGERLEAD